MVLSESMQHIVAGVQETARYLWEKGWAERNAGNISVNVTQQVGDAGDLSQCALCAADLPYPELAGAVLLLTGADTRMREVARDAETNCCLLRICDDLKGYQLLWGGKRPEFRPTSELPAHLAIHQFLLRTGARQRAFVHTHPTNLIALTLLFAALREDEINRLLWAMHPEVKIFVPEGVGCVPYQVPRSVELADATLAALQGHRVALWDKHGCGAIGVDAAEAFDLIHLLDKAAGIYLTCRAAGYEPHGLSPEAVEELGRRFPVE
jgi:rhamnulose-1-phosphate aldolase